MIRWMRTLAVAGALAALPGLGRGADTSAQAKDRADENAIHARMKAREKTSHPGILGKAKATVDQGADAVRAGGARVARTYHGAVHSGKKAVHHASKKASDATK